MQGHVKYWQIIIENLRKAGWNAALWRLRMAKGDQFGLWPQSAATLDALSCVQTKSCLPFSLESAIQTDRHNHECDCPEPDEVLGNHRRQSEQGRLELGLCLSD
jgi:hypothetical protein